MAHANRCSSKLALTGLGLAVLGLAGCAGNSGLMPDDLRLGLGPDPKEIRVVKGAAAPALRQTTDEPVQMLKAAKKPTAAFEIVPTAGKPDKRPAWCDYLTEDTAAQTTIMRSPSLSGSLNDSGKTAVSLGVSITDFAKANVLEQSAEARCRRYMAESGLQKLVFLSPQGLTNAGFRAKAKAIGDRKKDIQALRRRVAEAMNNGFVDREKASLLMGLADQLLAEAANAKSQADRRTADLLGSKDRASVLGRELLRAEADLEDLNSRMRTFDAVDVSVSAGFNKEIDRDNFDVQSEDFSGKVSFSMKLGAALPSRFEHERKAKEARLRALGDEGGALWQVNVLRLAHERAIEGLAESALKIDSAIAETRKLLTALADVDNPEFEVPGIGAKFRIIQLQADKAAVEGSIAEIRSNMKRLKADG
jgi:hypothetical protein